ncbi:MAG: sulfite exporter TauE/SafE family protein [Bacteroidetes bacterium]|nr:sulfite exporter TauE/SafE family protein [Bacteroidota bacterium]
MEWIQYVLNNDIAPILTAFILGILTAISPCPLATNITAIGFIGKDFENKNKIFINGLLYALGRIISYTTLGIILIYILKQGTSIYFIQDIISRYGEKIMPPILIIIGLFMLFGNKLNLPKIGYNKNYSEEKIKKSGGWGALFLGIVFALAFCPTSGIFYFGVLIPMSVNDSFGLLYPLVFAIATSLPVIIVAWILAYSISFIGKFYNSIQTIQKWFSRIVAIIFIAVGIYYAIIMIF